LLSTWLTLSALLLVAGSLILVFGVLPIATCKTCEGKGKYILIKPEDVVVIPGYKNGDVVRMKTVEHRPAYSATCPICHGDGRMTFYRKWSVPTQIDSAVGELTPEGPITTSTEMPDEDSVQKDR
jgi:hypothetical protein